MQNHLLIELFVLFIIKCDAFTVNGPNLAGKYEQANKNCDEYKLWKMCNFRIKFLLCLQKKVVYSINYQNYPI